MAPLASRRQTVNQLALSGSERESTTKPPSSSLPRTTTTTTTVSLWSWYGCGQSYLFNSYLLFQECDVFFVPTSGLSGENLTTRSAVAELTCWYSGPSLLEQIGNGDYCNNAVLDSSLYWSLHSLGWNVKHWLCRRVDHNVLKKSLDCGVLENGPQHPFWSIGL